MQAWCSVDADNRNVSLTPHSSNCCAAKKTPVVCFTRNRVLLNKSTPTHPLLTGTRAHGTPLSSMCGTCGGTCSESGTRNRHSGSRTCTGCPFVFGHGTCMCSQDACQNALHTVVLLGCCHDMHGRQPVMITTECGTRLCTRHTPHLLTLDSHGPYERHGRQPNIIYSITSHELR